MENLWKLMPLLLIFGAFMVCMLLIDRKSLNIKSKTVGDGQHGSASFATTKVKWIFDITALLLAIVLMLVLLGTFALNVVGLNTILSTIVNAPLIGLFGKLMDKRFCFDSAFPAFYEKFQKLMN